MKYLFCGIVTVLSLASVVTWRLQPEVQSELPVIYWVTDPNPARQEQIRIFGEWMARHKYPAVELKLDTANNDVSKKIIQGVSGVGGDIWDTGSGATLQFFHEVGLCTDVTDAARELGFDPSQTYPAMEPEITVAGRQYMFPCNVYVQLYWVNQDTFAKYGQPVPPRTWTWGEFERLGRAFVAAANPAGKRHTVFYANELSVPQLRRSLGLSVFNETLTRCTLDDPRYVRVLHKLWQWTYDDRLLPSAADRESFSTEGGYGGATLQLFNTGNYAMFKMGRYALIQLRQFGQLPLAVSHPPYAEFANAETGTRAAVVYKGSRHPELASYFLSYLASEEYNMQIVRDADALPPNPKYTEHPEFLQPPDWPNEWGCHEAFSEAAKTIAVGGVYSPYVLPATASRIDREKQDGFMSGIYTAEDTARRAAAEINAEIERTLTEKPQLRAGYEAALARQQTIEAKLRRGEVVAAAEIDNPFLRRYYLAQGWAE